MIKFQSNGRINWENQYSDCKEVFSIQQTNDGGYVFIATTSTIGPGENDIYLVKLNSGGSQEGYYVTGHKDYDENAKAVIQTNDGGYFIVGNSVRSQPQVYMEKINADDLISGTP